MKRKTLLFVLGLVVVLALGSSFLATLYSDWLWFGSLSISSVFSTMLNGKILLGSAATLIIFIIVFFNLKIVQRWLASTGGGSDPEVIQVDFSTGTRIPVQRFGRDMARSPFFSWIIFLVSLGFALINGIALGSHWLTWLSFVNQTPYGVNDPIFGRDVSFYLFSLPVLQEIYDVFFPMLLLLVAIIAFFYFSNRGLDASAKQRGPFRHLGTLGFLIFLARAAGYQLDIWQLVYSPRGVAFGASYSDMHALLPAYYICIALSLICALVMLTLWFKPRLRTLIAAPVVLVAFAILGTAVYPSLVESFQVTPNQFVLEQPYLKYNIDYTRMAYSLDTMVEEEFAIGGEADWAQLEAYSGSMENIPLLSYPQTQTVFTQLQGMRYYYRFNDIDVDRYAIGGRLTQMMIGPRELTADALQREADTWVNRYLKYTHGYGAVATPVKEYTTEGQPVLWVKDIPPSSSIPELNISEPRIYFGELTSDYAIVGTKSKEFDYPLGDINAENVYEGPDGLQLANIFDRLLFSLRLGTMNPILTNEITAESRILLYRQIMTRVGKIAPFLQFDPDPYLVIDNGRLVWIIDAYTVSRDFPYSTPWNEYGHNYISNSVKITLDAYDGAPKFYLINPDDPLIMTYQKIFPDLFLPFEEMPESLKAHLRYPEGMFTVQADKLLLYHMTDPGVFYNKEDSWSFATQTISSGTPRAIEPYYALMRFPDFPTEEFMIMLPLTPISKDNMVAYLTGRSDGDHLGELFVFKFPKERLVYGPAQIQARINQDAVISQDLALWRQSGASIEWGHMITVPLKDSLLYVNPLYIRSASTSLPELKRIVLAYGNTLVMEQTLEAGLQRIFGLPSSGETSLVPAEPLNPAAPTGTEEQLVEQLVQQYARVQEAFSKGDWVGYGQAMSELERLIGELEHRSATGTSPSGAIGVIGSATGVAYLEIEIPDITTTSSVYGE